MARASTSSGDARDHVGAQAGPQHRAGEVEARVGVGVEGQVEREPAVGDEVEAAVDLVAAAAGEVAEELRRGLHEVVAREVRLALYERGPRPQAPTPYRGHGALQQRDRRVHERRRRRQPVAQDLRPRRHLAVQPGHAPGERLPRRRVHRRRRVDAGCVLETADAQVQVLDCRLPALPRAGEHAAPPTLQVGDDRCAVAPGQQVRGRLGQLLIIN